jgi:hypothetical protein
MADAPQQKRQPLAHVTEDDLEPGMGVEHAAQHKAQTLGRGLDRKAPGGTQDAGMRLRVILVIGLDDRSVWQGGMNIDRHVELGGSLPDRPEALVDPDGAAPPHGYAGGRNGKETLHHRA